jgi:hypothetical protein
MRGDDLDRNRGVGSRRKNDRVLARRSHRDQRDAGACLGPADAASIYAGRAQVFDQRVSEWIAAYAADHRHAAAHTGSGYGLVRALAARNGAELPAGDRLARLGMAGGLDDQIHIQTADNNDMWTHGSSGRGFRIFDLGFPISDWRVVRL